MMTYRNYKSHFLRMDALKEGGFGRSSQGFQEFQMFSVPDGESGQSCGVVELVGHQ